MGSMSIVADIVAISCMCGSPFSEWVVMVLGWATRNCCHLFIAQQIKLISIFDTERHRPLLTATVCHWHSWVSNALFFDLPFPISHFPRFYFFFSPLKVQSFRNVKIFELKFMSSHSQRLTNFISFISQAAVGSTKKKRTSSCRQSLKIMFMIIIITCICTSEYIYI